jgi:hypothetical protein
MTGMTAIYEVAGPGAPPVVHRSSACAIAIQVGARLI